MNQVNWGGVAVLLIGAALGYFGDKIAGLWWPDMPKRGVMLRVAGLALAFAGTLWAILG